MSIIAAASESLLGGYLKLFGSTEIFIFVFMEIVSKLETIQRVVFKRAHLLDTVIFVLVFGFFLYSERTSECRAVMGPLLTYEMWHQLWPDYVEAHILAWQLG